MKEVTLEELLEAGCHFGHQVTRQNTKARDFIFEARDGVHIIDLAKTKEGLDEAASYIKALAQGGGTLVVIGTKRQARPIVDEEIKRAHEEGAGEGLFSVTNRWIGGTLTNSSEVSKNYKRLKDLEQFLKSEEEKVKYTKKEVGLMKKEKDKLESFYGGIKDMQRTPDALFIIDTHLEDLAVKEALNRGVTTVGLVDTNADPSVIDHPIPANDDAVGSIKFLVHHLMDAWIEGTKSHQKGESKSSEVKTEKKEEKEEASKKTKKEGKEEKPKKEKKAESKKKTKKVSSST